MKKIIIGLILLSSLFTSIYAEELDFSPKGTVEENGNVRKLLMSTEDGFYLVQDFYVTGQKLTDPYLLLEKNYINSNVFEYFEMPISGNISVWYKNGSKKYQIHYKDGMLNGKFEAWYESGQKEQEGYFAANKMLGKWTGFYKNNQKKYEFDYYEQGNENTYKVNVYYENGVKQVETNSKNGKLDGRYIRWYQNGQKEMQGNYYLGEQTGFWGYWSGCGNKVKEIEFDSQGNKIKEISFDNNKLD